jgi:hypothetical protein
MKRLVLLAPIALSIALLCAPQLASAQPLVPQCAGITCELCHLFDLANRIIQYAILAASIAAAALFAYAGAMLVFAAGDPTKIAKAKHTFGRVITGYVIALIAFLAVDTLINSIAQKKFTWKNVQCQTGLRKTQGTGLRFVTPETVVVPQTTSGTGAVSPEGLTTTLPPKEAVCTDCVKVAASVPGFDRTNSCSVSGGCLISSQISDQLVSFAADAKAAGISWEATELWPPTSSAHQNGCHYNGTCIDAAFRGTSASAQNIAQFISLASKNGFTAQYEVATSRDAEVIRMQAAQHGVTLGPSDVLVVPYINGSHFSMYKK